MEISIAEIKVDGVGIEVTYYLWGVRYTFAVTLPDWVIERLYANLKGR